MRSVDCSFFDILQLILNMVITSPALALGLLPVLALLVSDETVLLDLGLFGAAISSIAVTAALLAVLDLVNRGETAVVFFIIGSSLVSAYL
jgi:hypothetical protein